MHPSFVLLKKGILVFTRNKAAVLITFLVPVVLIALFGFVFDLYGNRERQGPTGIRLAIVNLSTPERDLMKTGFSDATAMFDPRPEIPIATLTDPAQVCTFSRGPPAMDGVVGPRRKDGTLSGEPPVTNFVVASRRKDGALSGDLPTMHAVFSGIPSRFPMSLRKLFP